MAGTLEKSNNAAGFSNGDLLTAAASGGASGDAWDRFIVPGDYGTNNTQPTISTTPTPPSLPAGNKWYHLTQAANGGQINIYWTKPTARTIWTCQGYLRVAVAPSTGVNLLQAFSNNAYGSTSLSLAMMMNPSRSFYLRNGKTGEEANGSNSAGTLALNTNYFWQLLINYSTLTATLNIYPVGSTTVTLTASVPFTTSNQVQSLRWGLGTANTGAEIYATNIQEGYGDWLTRPDIVNSGPTITLGAASRRTYQAGTVVEAPWSATDPDNVSSLTISWQTVPSGVTPPTISDKSGAAITGLGTTTASRTSQATLAQPGTYVMLATSADALGTTSTATYTFEIYPAVGTDTVIRSVSKGSFTVVGGPANDAAGALTALTDSNAATALDSVVTPSAMTGSLQLGPLGPSGIVLYVSAAVPDGGTLTRVWRVYKEDHTTQIYTTTETITGTTTDVPLTLDNTALSAVALNSASDIGRAALWVDWSDTMA